jgi:hypothetical protein
LVSERKTVLSPSALYDPMSAPARIALTPSVLD